LTRLIAAKRHDRRPALFVLFFLLLPFCSLGKALGFSIG
jgi:hypothetical protein